MIRIRSLLLENPDELVFRNDTGKKHKLTWDNDKAFAFWSLHENGEWIIKTDGRGYHPIILTYGDNFVKCMEFLEKYDKPAHERLSDIRQTDAYKNGYGQYEKGASYLMKLLIDRHIRVNGRVWKDITSYKIYGVQRPSVISLWKYPTTLTEMKTLIRSLGLSMDKTFIETNAEQGGAKWLVPATEYKTPKSIYVPRVQHELPPHLR